MPTDSDNGTGSARKLEFRSETRQILDIVINSLYTHPDVFLRELVSNASDALDRLRFESLSNPDLDPGADELRVVIRIDPEERTLTVSDNGMGMTADELVSNLGTIAGSGSRDFLALMDSKEAEGMAPELIGRFGVGFYSAFMVASEVSVRSTPAGDPEAGPMEWRSGGEESFTLGESPGPGGPERGTDVVLRIREGMEEYLDPGRIRELVTRYSDYMGHPIYLDFPEREGEEPEGPLNSMKPLWRKSREELDEQACKDLYSKLSWDLEPPLETIGYHAEGKTEFHALLFIPSSRSLRVLLPDYRGGLSLYARNVLIGESYEGILPRYLRFVTGVVECPDLPLNISRETVQKNALIRLIGRNLVRKILDTLDETRRERAAEYEVFFRNFGDLIREGIYTDAEHRDELADLLLVETPASEGRQIPLRDLVESMPEEREDLYYLTGASVAELRTSPHLERLGGSERTVLLLGNPLDELVMQTMGNYRGRKLVALDRDSADLEKDLGEEQRTRLHEHRGRLAGLTKLIADTLGSDAVSEVRVSSGLRESPCVVISDRRDPGPALRSMLEAMQPEGGEKLPRYGKVLEINPDHEVIASLQALFEKDRSNPLLERGIHLLWDAALILDGERLEDPASHMSHISSLISEAAESGGAARES